MPSSLRSSHEGGEPLNASEILSELETRGAVLRGHFHLTSGRHSDMFVQKFRVFEDPALTRSLGEALAHHYEGEFDVVACPAVGAIVLGFAAALAANKKMVFAERTGEGLEFRRGFSLAPHQRVLVVEDVITTGGSAREVVDLVKASGAEPIGIGALIDRCDPSRDAFGVPFHALVELKVESWDASDCPLCADGTPLEEPGSRRLRT